MAREPSSVTVLLYPSREALVGGEAGAEFLAPSRHQAVRQAAYALAGLQPCDAPAGAWVAARCRASAGSWEKVLLVGEG